MSGEGSATCEAAVETSQRIETQERERVADGVGVQVRMTLHCMSDAAHERSGVGQGRLDVRVLLLRTAHASIIDHTKWCPARTVTLPFGLGIAVAELDPEFTESMIMVVDRTNGQPLLADEDPFRIVAPSDLPGARSMRMLERIEVIRLPKR